MNAKAYAIIKSTSILIFLIFLFSCGQGRPKNEDIRKEKTFESEGIKIITSANYSKKFRAGIAVAGPHAPVVLPYAGFKKKFFITIQPDKRECFFVEPNSDEISIEGDEIANESIESMILTFSPDTDHLLYQGKILQKDTLIIIHYLDKKFPFTSSYYENFISPEKPNWKKVPGIVAIATRIIMDTTKLYRNGYLNDYAIPNEEMFWEALKKLPRENEIDYIVLNHFNTKPFTMRHLEYACSDWGQRSSNWKGAVIKKFRSIYNELEQTGNGVQDSYPDAADADNCIETILKSCKDKKMKGEYFNFLINNFEKGLANPLGYLIQSDSIEDKAFINKHSNIIASRCEMILEQNDPRKTDDALYISKLMGNSLIYNKAVEKAIELWPASPLDQTIKSFTFLETLTVNQNQKLLEKAQRLLGTDDHSVAVYLLEGSADCELLRTLKKKYAEISLRYECEDK